MGSELLISTPEGGDSPRVSVKPKKKKEAVEEEKVAAHAARPVG